jgi:hypothetical protein
MRRDHGILGDPLTTIDKRIRLIACLIVDNDGETINECFANDAGALDGSVKRIGSPPLGPHVTLAEPMRDAIINAMLAFALTPPSPFPAV